MDDDDWGADAGDWGGMTGAYVPPKKKCVRCAMWFEVLSA